MTLYFAYGSNMDRTGMRLRCPAARALGTAALDGWRLLVMRDGYVSVVPRAGACVHGVLWQLGPNDLAALDAYEAVDAGLYRRQVVDVLHDGKRRSAEIYIGCSDAEGRPRPGHMPLVIAAAQGWDLPAAYLDEMRQWLSPQGGEPG
jgi:gamma-glutamylcyclotransferase (GGCT)/AIG2-like uncharacterized protein YtfP